MEFVLLFLTLSLLASGSSAVTFTIKNNCPYTLWPATLTSGGSPQLSSTGFQLQNGESIQLTVPPQWSGRIWARTLCSTDPTTGKFTCATADCGSGQTECLGSGGIPPASLAEFTLGSATGLDFYDLSLVDGFNLPLSVVPVGAAGCSTTSCAAEVDAICPPELSVEGIEGSVVACRSACLAFNEPQYCCTGPYGSPETCPPTSYSKIFKGACPQAYSYAYDDKSSTFTCSSGGDYIVTFCPPPQ